MKRYTLFELVLMAILAALGIAVKPLLVPITHIVCGPLMIPAGAMAGGLYMMWLIIGYGLIKKPGTALIISVIQALLVLFTGVIGSHGIISLFTYITPGLAAEIVLLLCRKNIMLGAVLGCAAANIAGTAAVNVVFFQTPGVYLILVLSIAALSGMIGGVISWKLIDLFQSFAFLAADQGAHFWQPLTAGASMDRIQTKDAEKNKGWLLEQKENQRTVDQNDPRDDGFNMVQKKKKGRTKKILLIAALILIAAAGISLYLNQANVAKDDVTTVTVKQDGQVLKTYTLADLEALQKTEKYVSLVSSGTNASGTESGTFAGVLLTDLAKDAGITEYKTAVMTAGDGYASAASLEEAPTVLIAYTCDGESLGYFTKGGTGPYRGVFTEDTYGNRSLKYLTAIDFKK